MADLFWPGDHRAGELLDDASFLEAMVRVEQAWLDTLADADLASSVPLAGAIASGDLEAISEAAEAGGNPVIGLVSLLRDRTGVAEIHRGLTSQDVLDTALVLCLGEAVARIRADVARQAHALSALVQTHRDSLMVGRTLTQHAVPITFGLKAATWLQGLSAATGRLDSCAGRPAQLGGAAGTWAAVTVMAGGPVPAAELAERAAARLGLDSAAPWHTERSTLTILADALVGLGDVWGRIARDVALGSRPEIGELREAAGGGSSTMPGKANPVLSTLLTRHALAAPGLAATLHVAAASYVDERPDGAWHVEWETMRTLARRTVVAADQAADLLEGLLVDADAMRNRALGVGATLTAERRSVVGEDGSDGGDGGEDPAGYLGATEQFIDAALDRARLIWKDLP